MNLVLSIYRSPSQRQQKANISEFCCFISSIKIIFDLASLNASKRSEVGIVKNKNRLRKI